MNCMFAGFTPDEAAQWIVSYREINNDLIRDKVIVDMDNAMKLVHCYYNAHFFPLRVSLEHPWSRRPIS